MVLRPSLVCGCNIKLCIDHGYTGESNMKSIAAIVTRTMCDFHLTTFPPPNMHSPPHFPSVPFRPSLQSPPTSLFLQNPSVFVFQPGLFAQEIVYIGSIQEGTEQHSRQLRLWPKGGKKVWKRSVIPKLLNRDRNRSQLFSSPQITSLPFCPVWGFFFFNQGCRHKFTADQRMVHYMSQTCRVQINRCSWGLEQDDLVRTGDCGMKEKRRR